MKVMLLPILIPGIVGGIIYLIYFGVAGVPVGLWTTALPAACHLGAALRLPHAVPAAARLRPQP